MIVGKKLKGRNLVSGGKETKLLTGTQPLSKKKKKEGKKVRGTAWMQQATASPNGPFWIRGGEGKKGKN